jgi:hypothetical protein
MWEYKRALVEVERSSTHIWMMAGKLKRRDESRTGVALPYTNGALWKVYLLKQSFCNVTGN